MQCVRCAYHKFSVVRTDRDKTVDGKYSPKSDFRIYRCKSCGKEHHVGCVLGAMPIYDPKIMAERAVSIEEYIRKWLPIEQSEMPQTGLFSGGGRL